MKIKKLNESIESKESELITQYINNGEFDKLEKVKDGTNVIWKLKEPINSIDESKSIKEGIDTWEKDEYSNFTHFYHKGDMHISHHLDSNTFGLVYAGPGSLNGHGRGMSLGSFKSFEEAENAASEFITSSNDKKSVDESKSIKEDAAEDKIVAKNNKGEILVRADSGWGYTAFNAVGVCIGGITTDDEDEAIRKFKSGKLDESKSINDDKPLSEDSDYIEPNIKELFTKFYNIIKSKLNGDGYKVYIDDRHMSIGYYLPHYENWTTDQRYEVAIFKTYYMDNGEWCMNLLHYDIKHFDGKTFRVIKPNGYSYGVESKTGRGFKEFLKTFKSLDWKFLRPLPGYEDKCHPKGLRIAYLYPSLDKEFRDFNESLKHNNSKGLKESATHCVYFNQDGVEQVEFEGTEDECQDYIEKQEADNEFGDEAPERFVKRLTEASYGGAFDIADDQYFTRDDIENAAEEVLNHINETFTEQYELGGTWFEDGRWIVNVKSIDGEWEFEELLPIDMRKIKEPWHLKREYAFDMASKFINKITLEVHPITESLNEDTDTIAVEGPKEGPEAGLSSLINEAIQDELKTIDIYNSLSITARSEGYEDIAKMIDEINTEENKHVGQLQEALKSISPNAVAIEDGTAEGQEQLSNMLIIDDDLTDDELGMALFKLR